MTPFYLKDENNFSFPVPCGKCPACYARRISGWSFRLMQEEKISSSAHFITLTYDTTHVPITRNGFMELKKRDVQLFIKRLRKAHDTRKMETKQRVVHSLPIKYYAVGEYGGKTKRPHYHAILFNSEPELIEKAWQLGQIHYGKVSAASVGYTMKYMSKPAKIPMHKNDDRQPEFSLMSKGLGASYMTAQMLKWHKADLLERMYLNIEDGKKIAMPRYYKDKIYNHDERSLVGGYQKGQMEAKQKELEQNPDYFTSLCESHKAAFRKLQKDSANRDKL